VRAKKSPSRGVHVHSAVALGLVAGAVVEQAAPGWRPARPRRVARVGAADLRPPGRHDVQLLGVERDLRAQGQRAGVARVHRQRRRDRGLGGRLVVALLEQHARRPRVGVGVLRIQLEHVAEEAWALSARVSRGRARPTRGWPPRGRGSAFTAARRLALASSQLLS
jgi:hypothetical protein